MAVRKVVIGLVTNPLCRAGDVAVLSPSSALDRAISRGWVEVTHTVEDGVVEETAESEPKPRRRRKAETEVDTSFLDSEYPGYDSPGDISSPD